MKNEALSCLLMAIFVSYSVLADDKEPESQIYAPTGEMDNIIVTAMRLPRAIAEIAGTVSVITAEELDRQVASDLDDLVRYQPGLSMDTAGRGGNQGFIIRGIGGNRVLTLVDGVRSNDIYSAGPASYGQDSFEVDDLKSVEVIRGPASVLYGADALGGAVILHTKNPQDYLAEGKDSFISTRIAGYSADDQAKLGLTAVKQWDQWGSMLQFTHRDFNEKTIEGRAKLNPQDGISNALLLKSVWIPNEKHHLSINLEAVHEDIDYLLLSDIKSSVTSSQGADETRRYRLSLHHRWDLDTDFADHVDSQIFWQQNDALQNTVQQRTSYSFFSAPFGTDATRHTDFEFNQTVVGISIVFSKGFKAGSVQHDMVYGVNHEVTDTERPRNRCETEISSGMQTCDILAYPFSGAESFPNKTFPDTETTRRGIFWQDEMVLGDSGFTIIPGIRYDYYRMEANTDGVVGITGFDVKSLSESDISANLGLIYDINDEVAFFAQYAQGFRPPNFDEANQSFVNLNFNYATVPNPDLKPEISDGFELGIKASFSNAYIGLVVFDNRYDDFISSQYIGEENGISLYQDRNIGEAHISGVELMGTWQLDNNWKAHSSIAYARGDDEIANEPLDSIEPLTSVFGFAYDADNDRWGMEAVVTLVDKKDRVSDESRVTSSGYGLTDVFGYYQMSENLRLNAGVYNVFNKQYPRWANIAGMLATSSNLSLAQETGTEYRVSLNLSF